jgi:chromosome segregation ATPase
MLKKALVCGAVLLLGTWGLSRTDLGSYVKVVVRDAFTKVKDSVPPEMQLKVAEENLAKLDDVEDKLIVVMAKEMATIETKQRDIADMQANLTRKKDDLRVRRDALKTDDQTFITTDGRRVIRAQFERETDLAVKTYKDMAARVENEKALLAEHQARLDAAKEQRESLKATKAALAAKLEKLKTELEVLKAKEAQCKKTCGAASQIPELENAKRVLENAENTIRTRSIENDLRQDGAKAPAAPARSAETAQELDRIVGETGVATGK